MGWNIWGVGGISPIFHNIAGVGGLGIPPLEGLGVSENLKTALLLSTNQLPQKKEAAMGLIMNLEF